jgi:hypothetical protein
MIRKESGISKKRKEETGGGEGDDLLRIARCAMNVLVVGKWTRRGDEVMGITG